jgi:hypothetical protein
MEHFYPLLGFPIPIHAVIHALRVAGWPSKSEHSFKLSKAAGRHGGDASSAGPVHRGGQPLFEAVSLVAKADVDGFKSP